MNNEKDDTNKKSRKQIWYVLFFTCNKSVARVLASVQAIAHIKYRGLPPNRGFLLQRGVGGGEETRYFEKLHHFLLPFLDVTRIYVSTVSFLVELR